MLLVRRESLWVFVILFDKEVCQLGTSSKWRYPWSQCSGRRTTSQGTLQFVHIYLSCRLVCAVQQPPAPAHVYEHLCSVHVCVNACMYEQMWVCMRQGMYASMYECIFSWHVCNQFIFFWLIIIAEVTYICTYACDYAYILNWTCISLQKRRIYVCMHTTMCVCIHIKYSEYRCRNDVYMTSQTYWRESGSSRSSQKITSRWASSCAYVSLYPYVHMCVYIRKYYTHTHIRSYIDTFAYMHKPTGHFCVCTHAEV
jgi:hypothetical protein